MHRKRRDHILKKALIYTVLGLLLIQCVFPVQGLCAGSALTLNIGYDADSGQFNITGNAAPRETVFLQVLKPGKTTADNASDSVFYANDDTADVNGTYSFAFKLYDGLPGEYTFRVSAYGEDTVEKTEKIINMAALKGAIKAINDATDKKPIADLFTTGNGVDIFGFDGSIYDLSVNHDVLFEKILAEKNKSPYTESDLSPLEKVFMSYSALCAVNSAENPQAVMEKYASLLGHLEGNDNRLKTFNEVLDDNGRAAVYVRLAKKGFTTTEALKAAYTESVILTAAEGSQWQQITNILDINSDALTDLNISDYKSLDEPHTVAQAMAGSSHSSLSAFISAFNGEIKAQAEAEKGGGSGGSRGSGGGGGGSFKPSSSMAAPTEEIKEIPQAQGTAFTDLANVSWAAEAIEAFSSKGYLSGKGDGIFAPDEFVTREEYVKILVLATGNYDAMAKSGFADVPEGHWSDSFIASAVNAGLIQGIDESTFGLGKPITRQDMCVILYRLTKDRAATGNEAVFTDAEEISEYARDAVKHIQMLGIVGGMPDGSFRPLDNLTRAQAAKVIYEVVK